MFQSYKDIISKLGEPWWHDANGVPRYTRFYPCQSANIYADEVALVVGKCQSCGKELEVEVSWCRNSIANFISPVTIHPMSESMDLYYGDAPYHNCHAGETMILDLVRVVEFWVRDSNEKHGWKRRPELEVALIEHL